MAQRTVVDCDGCGKQSLKEHKKLFVVTGRHMDASGNGSEDDGELLFLCTECLGWLVDEYILKARDYGKNSQLLKSVKERHNRLKKQKQGCDV